MKCYAKSSVNLIARLANLHPKTTFFIKVFSFVFLVPEKRIIFAKVQRRIKSKIRLSYRLSFKLLVVNQSNMLHRNKQIKSNFFVYNFVIIEFKMLSLLFQITIHTFVTSIEN